MDEVPRRVDAGLDFVDAQPGLLSTACDVSSANAASLDLSGVRQPDPRSAKPIAHVEVDGKAGTETWTDPAKKEIPPGRSPRSAAPGR